MRLERTKNAKRNIVFGLLNKIVTLFYPFVLRTFIIQKIGAEYLGLSSLFSSILQVLNLTELGLSSAVVFCMYKPIAEDDNETLCAILNFYKKIYLIIGVVILVLGSLIIPVIPRLIRGEVPENVNIKVLYIIYLISTVISYFLFAYKSSLLNAYQRVDVISSINTLVFMVTYTMQLIIVLCTNNFYYYALTNILSTVFINISTAVCTNKLFPDIKCVGELNNSIKKELRDKIKGLMINKITGITRNSFDSIFISLYVGLLETAIYNNYFYILYAVTGFIVVLNSSISAGIGNSVAIESEEKNYNDFRKLNFLYMWLSGWATICMLCLYQPFTEIFFGKNMLFPIVTVVVFCLYFYQLKTGDIMSSYADAHGIWWEMRYASIIEAIGNFLLNMILGKYFGAMGIVSATTISLFITSFFIGSPISMKKAFPSIRYNTYIKMHLFYFVVTVVIGAITYSICLHISLQNKIVYLLVCALICAVVPTVLYVLVYFRLKIFKDSLKWIYSKILVR